ncbi:MAG: gamma-glutamylcyclotransferase family protein [Gemmatimonadota bacterium]
MPLYFAYASNLSRAQMTERCPAARAVGRAYIPDHRLGFVGHSESWGGGTATILLAPGAALWGALYDVDASCVEELARREGAAYVGSRTSVLGEDGRRTHVFLFVRARDFEEHPPSERYVETIRRGYADWDLDAAALDRAVGKARASQVRSDE